MLSKHLLGMIRINNGRCNTTRRSYSFFKHMKEVKAYEEGEEPFDPKRPIRFSTSPAANWNIRNIRYQRDPYMDAPWYKPVILFGVMMGTVVYLNYYRQRNDLDDELEMPLGKRVLQIREMQINIDRNRAISNGQSTKSFDADLEEINRLRKKYKYDED